MTSKARAGWVSSIAAAAEKNGVTATPTMFLNGDLIDIQNLTPEALQTMITTATQK